MIKISTLVVLFTVAAIPANGLFTESLSIQDYVDQFIDSAKNRFLNESSIGQIWSFFKSNYGRVYSSIGEFDHHLTSHLALIDFRGRETTAADLS